MSSSPDISHLPRTTILVNERLPKKLTKIVLGYVRSEYRDWRDVVRAGEYETCLHITGDLSRYGLWNACIAGYMELVNLMISKGANICHYCAKSMADHMTRP